MSDVLTASEGTQSAPAPADATAAKGTLASKFSDPSWMQRQNIQGSPEWHERQNLQATINGMSRAELDHVRDTGAPPKVIPTPAPATSPSLRENVTPGLPPSPEQLTADQLALAEEYAAQAAKATESSYGEVKLAGVPALSSGDQAEMRKIALAEKLAPAEFSQFTAALGIAIRDAENGVEHNDAYNERTHAALKRTWGADYDRMLGFARSQAQELMARHPQLQQLFTSTVAGSNEHVIRALAERGLRRSLRRT